MGRADPPRTALNQLLSDCAVFAFGGAAGGVGELSDLPDADSHSGLVGQAAPGPDHRLTGH